MSDERTGLTGVEVDPKPHSHEQGEQLAGHKVNLETQKGHTYAFNGVSGTCKRFVANIVHPKTGTHTKTQLNVFFSQKAYPSYRKKICNIIFLSERS